MKMVSILDSNEKPVGYLPLDVACRMEGWDYETTDFGLEFGLGLNIAGECNESRESRTDEDGNTITMVWKVL